MTRAFALLALWSCSAAAQGLLAREQDELAGAIAGRACRDLDRDGRCGADEPGYAGLRLVLETGQQVTTDPEGRYHLAKVEARTPDLRTGLRLLPGRHRVRVDTRRLPPGARVLPEAVTLEVPMAGLILQNFAVQTPEREEVPLEPLATTDPPGGGPIADGAILHELTGRARPGERVTVNGNSAQVAADGSYRAEVPLQPGANELSIRVDAGAGDLRFFVQRVDVVVRRSGLLVVPRAPRAAGGVRLPGAEERPAAAGASAVEVHGAPGTIVRHGDTAQVIGDDGVVRVPVVLAPGANELALRLTAPGEGERTEKLAVEARPRGFAVALLDVEAALALGTDDAIGNSRISGRGAAHGELPLGALLLEGQLDLRDRDLLDAREAGIWALAQPRRVEELQRALDPDRHPHSFGDDSTTLVPNAGESRLRLSATHPEHGAAGLGTFRAAWSDSEVGRYHRGLFGPHARVHTAKDARGGAEVLAFASPGAADPFAGLATVSAHAEFVATGGSLFYLPHGSVLRGSEQVRVVLRDGLTSVPVAEHHLVRGVDYELDPLSGRLLLARPLSMVAGLPLLATDLPQAGAEPLLVVDYERLVFGASRGAAGAQVGGRFGGLDARVGAVQEGAGEDGFQLVRGVAGAKLGPLHLSLEAARSSGHAHRAEDVSFSESGGLDWIAPPAARGAATDGWAITARLRGSTFNGGRIDAAYRRRTPGFSDASWDGRGALTQAGGSVEQPLGSLRLGLLGDARTAVDPRDPFGDRELATRTLGAYVAYRAERFEIRLEGRDQALTTDVRDPDTREEGARTSVGLAARFRAHERFWLTAGHRHSVAVRGEGPGAYDDTFSQAGADVKVNDHSLFGIRGGWGPRLGALAWAHGQVADGADTYYGSYSVDVDGPDVGQRRAVTGARTQVDGASAVFVEDVTAHDANAVRLARAVGLSHALGGGMEVSARYERGVRHPLDLISPLRRDAGGAGASWVRERVRLSGRAEVRRERGTPIYGAGVAVDRWQRVLSAAASVDVLRNLRLSGRVNASDTRNLEALEALLLESSVGFSWRLEPFMLVGQWAIERERRPDRPMDVGLQRVSLMPSLRLGDRFALASGAHVGWSNVGGTRATVVSGSVRPSVRVVGGLELAAEVARRSAAPDGGELTALRGEAGYRFGDELLMAVGYSVFGFQGLGLSVEREAAQRLYLRAEAAW